MPANHKRSNLSSVKKFFSDGIKDFASFMSSITPTLPSIKNNKKVTTKDATVAEQQATAAEAKPQAAEAEVADEAIHEQEGPNGPPPVALTDEQKAEIQKEQEQMATNQEQMAMEEHLRDVQSYLRKNKRGQLENKLRSVQPMGNFNVKTDQMILQELTKDYLKYIAENDDDTLDFENVDLTRHDAERALNPETYEKYKEELQTKATVLFAVKQAAQELVGSVWNNNKIRLDNKIVREKMMEEFQQRPEVIQKGTKLNVGFVRDELSKIKGELMDDLDSLKAQPKQDANGSKEVLYGELTEQEKADVARKHHQDQAAATNTYIKRGGGSASSKQRRYAAESAENERYNTEQEHQRKHLGRPQSF